MDRSRTWSRTPTGRGSTVTPQSGLASSRSTRTGGLWTRMHGGMASPSRGEDEAPELGPVGVAAPTPPTAHLHRDPPLTACATGGPGRAAGGHARCPSQPDQMPEGSCRGHQPPGGDAGQPRTPAQSGCSHPSFEGRGKHRRAALRASDPRPVHQRSTHGERDREGGGDAGDRREEATSVSPVLCVGPATRPRGWGSAGRPGG